MKTILASFVLALVILPQSASAQQVDYDDFARLNWDAQADILSHLPKSDRAALVKVQATRWLRDNGHRLDASQQAAFDRALVYLNSVILENESSQTEISALQKDLSRHVSKRDIREAFTSQSRHASSE